MTDDPIVSEVRRARREILESFGWNCRKMLQDAMKRQKESGRQTVRLEKKTPRDGIAPRVYYRGPQR